MLKSFVSTFLSQKKKILFLFILLSLIVVFFYFQIHHYVQFDFLLQEKARLLNLYESKPVLFVLGFIIFYIFYATFSLPGAAILTLTAGFIFQFVLGSLIVVVASVTGAFFSFLISRYFLRDYLKSRFQSHFALIDEGFKKEGLFYLFSLRLIPAVPFFMVNLLMGVTSISSKHYLIGSSLGMLPGIFVYVNAGRQLASLKSPSDILSFPVLLSFLFLAFLPWILKFLMKFISSKKK